MKKYLNLDEVVFEIDYYKTFDKEEADKETKGLSEEEFENFVLKGKYKVHKVTILQSKYSKEALQLSGYTVRVLSEFIKDIESMDFKIKAPEYYS